MGRDEAGMGHGGGFTYSLGLKLIKGETFFGSGLAQLLVAIDETKSLKKAAQKAGMSYSKAWNGLKLAEEKLGYPLLERTTGGAGGGGSVLTEEARVLVGKYRYFEQQVYHQADVLFKEIMAGE